MLDKLKDPDDNKKIVSKIFKRDELYQGPFVREAPDLLVVMRDYEYITRGGYELVGDSLLSPPQINHSGNHRINGIAFFQGPNIKKDFKMPDLNIIDLCPTILSMMEIPVPGDVDGRVVEEIFEIVHH